MSDVTTNLMELLEAILNGDQDALRRFSESPVDTVDAYTDVPSDVDPAALVAEALAGTDLDPATQAAILDAVNNSASAYGPADEGYTSQQLAEIFAQGINITVEEGDEIYVDNSLYVEGDVKGGIHQANTTNITDADDGAIIANGAQGSNFQTGEGNVQLTDVHADNITTGDNNTVASDYSTIGNENVDAEYIANSEFGSGNQDRSVDADVKIDGSFTDDDVHKGTYSDDDVTTTKLDLDLEKGTAYGEPAPEPYYEPKPSYDDDPKPVYDEEPKPLYEDPKPVYEEPKPVYEEPAYEPEPTYYEPKPEYDEPTYEPEPEPYDG